MSVEAAFGAVVVGDKLISPPPRHLKQRRESWATSGAAVREEDAFSEVRSTVIAAGQQDSEGTASQPRQKRLRRGQAVRHKTVAWAWASRGGHCGMIANNLPFSPFGCSLTSSICHTKRYVPILATPRLIHTLFYARQADVLLTLRCGAKGLASLCPGCYRGIEER